MAFFKVGGEVKFDGPKNTPTVIYNNKRRYIIGDDGKGYWIRPLIPFDNNYDKEIDF